MDELPALITRTHIDLIGMQLYTDKTGMYPNRSLISESLQRPTVIDEKN